MIQPLNMDPGDLFALQFLLEERHVTRAARRLGVSQSSMSHRLAKLREDLGDELLIPEGKEFFLSARAEAMVGPLSLALAAVSAALSEPTVFEPITACLSASLAMPDLLAPHLPGLVSSLQKEAPGIELSIRPVPAQLNDFLAGQECALAIAPNVFAGSATIQRGLGQLKFGVLHRREHPLACGRLTMKRWLKYGHIVVSIENSTQNPISRALDERGETRQIALQVPTFLAGLMVTSKSDLIMNAPLSLVGETLERFDLVARPLPLSVSPLQLSLMWHARNQRDPAHVWLRERVHCYFKRALDEKPGSRLKRV